MTASDENAVDDRHRARMERKKAVVDAKIDAATRDQGMLLIHIGH